MTLWFAPIYGGDDTAISPAFHSPAHIASLAGRGTVETRTK